MRRVRPGSWLIVASALGLMAAGCASLEQTPAGGSRNPGYERNKLPLPSGEPGSAAPGGASETREAPAASAPASPPAQDAAPSATAKPDAPITPPAAKPTPA